MTAPLTSKEFREYEQLDSKMRGSYIPTMGELDRCLELDSKYHTWLQEKRAACWQGECQDCIDGNEH